MYQLPSKKKAKKLNVQLLSSGSIMGEVLEAAAILEKDYKVSSDIWSVTSFNELGRDVQSVQRWNMLHPDEKPKQSYVQQSLAKQKGPVISATDYMKAHSEQIRSDIEVPYIVLGTDGFGRSDSRENLRSHFEVDRYYVVYAALVGLVESGDLDKSVLSKALKELDIDPEKVDPIKL